ncbi:hypothetical protein SLEP1_g27106 [Rubroshorea leprosula]|uniref:Leucine-rich repeat-containing N-terminal plant-type domain-containing protein n=1 Tax=Rubroshorea leprosula TaxID=152421 RepID=A0AAV5K033_9ROSI|nr:hypothetical protein SLEP1_g27106 [Rubroshorea leprosula]
MSCLRILQLLCLFLFILNFQTTLSSALFTRRTKRTCFPKDRAALLHFKNAFSIDHEYVSILCDAFRVESYPKTESWNEGTDCCSWDGVTCDNVTGHVIGLDLNCSWLSGTFLSNSSLFTLSNLQRLNLAYNDFQGSKLSPRFGQFASLVYLNLSNSGFSGQVPSEISHLNKLLSLDLSSYLVLLKTHTLKGLVQNLTEVRQLFLDGIDMYYVDPSSFMNLPFSLTHLSLGNCNLKGNFSENIFQLPNLVWLNLGGNFYLIPKLPKSNWSGPLEYLDLSETSFYEEFSNSFVNLASLRHLSMEACLCSGSLPRALGNLTQLIFLDLSRNHIIGQIPFSFTNLTQLQFLYLQDNHLVGPIPDQATFFMDLREIDLSQNFLEGSIPSWVFNIPSLELLDLSYNQLTSQIPSSFTNLTQLVFLYLYNNHLVGPIPDQATSLLDLRAIDLSNNFLMGSIPFWVLNISTLESLSFRNNQLTGQLNEFQYGSLQSISLANNRLKGPIPSSISHLLNLTLLDLSSNNLNGIFDLDMFSKLKNLQVLDLSQNIDLSFISTINITYTLPCLTNLILSSCNTSQIPKFLRGLEGLKALDLSNNKIQDIPEWMWDVGKNSLNYLNLSHNLLVYVKQLPWKSLEILDLNFNLIKGPLPVPPSNIHFYSVSNNSLMGEIPSLICSLSQLVVLDLSHNNLSGVTPPCLGNLSSLEVLNLRMNKLRGMIPTTFANGCTLKNLNLNANQLEGLIPRAIVNCKDLQVLELGNNNLYGRFPHWLGTLPHLQVLVLRTNKLYGFLRDSKTSHFFPKLQIFDVSNNHFSGPIPTGCIKNLKAMMTFKEGEIHEQYMGGYLVSGIFYQYSVSLVEKGFERERTKILTILTSIDLSNNKFDGEIPDVIGRLCSLIGLNLSHNKLSGHIPQAMGNLTNLEWLDLSSNHLAGEIPRELVNLKWLSVLNLSNNLLDGPIPQGKQFNTFDKSSYEGNLGLCGLPLSKACSEVRMQPKSQSTFQEKDELWEFGWKVVLLGYGCGLAFGLFMGYLVLRTGKPKWLVTVATGL